MKMLLNIDVPDLEEAETFYAFAFDLVPARRFGDEVVEMLGAETAIYLLKKQAGSTGAGTEARDYARHWMPMHVDVVVEDLARALARALDAGAVQEGEIRDANWGRIVQIADPFGHGWCLLQFVGRGYDEITT
jgi:predicted enzyme related to lactoylglutathione lyase